ncbi:MAG: DUF2281 domain-containing protein [Candidatus Bipolaricaulota bacterium]|nr:DUF2281 domain-containing protein [Candidatus Bipolaricaulota bacterium]
MKTLTEKIHELPPEFQREVEDFVDFLLERKVSPSKSQRKLRLSWAGALREFRDRFTALELQQKALEWWGD